MGTLEFQKIKGIVNEELFQTILLIVESEYNHKSVVRGTSSKEIVFKNRQNAIELVKQQIIDFSREKNLDQASVIAATTILLKENRRNNPLFADEYVEVESVVKGLPEDR